MKSGTRRNSERKKRNKIPEEFFTIFFFLSCAPLLLLFRVGLGFFIVFIDPRQTVYNDGTMTKRLLFRLLGNGPIFSLKLILFSNQMNRLEANNNNHVLFNLIDFILPFHWICFFSSKHGFGQNGQKRLPCRANPIKNVLDGRQMTRLKMFTFCFSTVCGNINDLLQ